MFTRSLSYAVGLSLVSVSLSHAATLAEYLFTGGVATSSDADPSTTASNFGLTASGSSISAASNNLFLRSNATSSSTLAESITNNTFFSFTLTPGGGVQLNLQTLRLNHGASNSDTDASFFTNLAVLSSVGGFTESSPVLATFTKEVPINNGGAGITDPQVIDLTTFGSTFTNLTAPVEFRFYFYDSVSFNNKIHRLDTVQLEGTVIPESSSVALVMLGTVGALFRRSKGVSPRKFQAIL